MGHHGPRPVVSGLSTARTSCRLCGPAFPDQLPLGTLGQRGEDAEHEAADHGGGVESMRLAGEHPQAEGAQAVVESRTIVAREVVVVVHLVDAGVLQGVALQVQRLRARENGSENRPDRPTAVGPVFAPATRSGPAAPLHAERRRPAAHRGAAATAQQAGLRAAGCACSATQAACWLRASSFRRRWWI